MSAVSLVNTFGARKRTIRVFSRENEEMLEEIIFGEDLLRLAYGTKLGLKLTSELGARRWVSWLMGLYYDSRFSRSKIAAFAKLLEIDLEESENDVRDYQTFNEFFARKLKAECRPIDPDPRVLVSPGDGRLLVFPRIDEETLSYIKWAPVHLVDLFNRNPSLVERYRNGACAVLRLCPADYHRLHFPVSGTVGPTTSVPGLLHSVNPYALEEKIPVYALNKRTICSIESQAVGSVVMMEIGALGVGSIVQTYQPNTQLARSEEKGYFKFGGSTTILFFERDKVEFDDDLRYHSAKGVETIVKMGQSIATATEAP